MEACTPLPSGAGFIQSVLAFIDCQAQTLGAGGFLGLSQPGSTLVVVLTGFLTLFVALFGYRLLLGHGTDVRTTVLGFAKVGIVLALATSWPAYRTLVYDVALRGPTELGAEIAAPSGLATVGTGLVERLDGADHAFIALAILGEGRPPVPVDANQAAAGPEIAPQAYPGFNTFAIGLSRMLFLIGAIGGLAAVRLVAGLLLGLGPFFVGFLLFDNTRSLFEGWVRGLGGAALGALGISVALGAELALLEPWLADILARRGAEEWLPGMPVELLVVSAVFALIVLAMLYGAARIAMAFRLAPVWRAVSAQVGGAQSVTDRSAASAVAGLRDTPPAEARSRAATVVDAVAATQRREATQVAMLAARDASTAGAAGSAPGARRATPAGTARGASETLAPVPLGESFRRRTRARVSASAGRRDRRS
jgi:type IV secretion system protein VirB6